ncbi:hypothetical protein [Streptomyces mirabilis]|uniref:Uncharacterized protein n=1 Tax=Streptomyces mirabilis TaxID=68239 RepID=A0ABU3V6I6_9ACTN|nr:hypothetical protein [Streptomyces mirabilis]MDU9001788.1 hypothetical protein [Streptomyces mirabilis]
MDFADDDLSELPDPAYAVVTCRLVYRFVADKGAFLDPVPPCPGSGRDLPPVTELADRREETDPLKTLDITAPKTEVLTSRRSAMNCVNLDRLACFALRP